MSRVYTGNVFLSTSREALDKIFFSNSRVSNLKDGLLTLNEEELKKTFLVSPLKNTNLINFEYSLGEEKSNGYTLRLNFLETDSLFELFFVGKSVESVMLNKLYEALYENQDPSGLITKDQKRKVEDVIFNSDSNLLLNQVKLYFSFGVGDDLNDWAGPFVANLSKSFLTTTGEGIKEIELIFTCTEDFFLSNEIESEVTGDIETAVNKYNRIISNRNFIRGDASIETTVESLRFNSHEIVRDLIKKYISNVSQNKNVIVFLPNISDIVFNYVQSSKDKENAQNANKFVNPMSQMEAFAKSQLDDPIGKEKKYLKEFFQQLGIYFEVKVDKEILPLTLEEMQENQPKKEIEKIILSMRTDSSDSDSINAILPDFYYPLRKFLDGIRKFYEKEKIASDIKFFEEPDIRTLRLWKKYNFIVDDTRPALLFISQNYCDNVLYLRNIKNFDDLFGNNREYTHKMLETDLAFNDLQYKVEFYNTFLKVPISSSFKEKVLIKDELALDERSEELKKIAELINTPIFKFNLRNPNVLGINIDYNGSYLGAYNLGIRKKALLPFVNKGIEKEARNIIPLDVLKIISDSLKDIDFSNLPVLMKEISKLYTTEGIRKNPDLLIKLNIKEISETLTKDQLVTFIAILLSANKNSSKPGIVLDQDDDEVMVQREILEQLQKLAIRVKIKTLPFFRLSGTRVQNLNCLLLAAQNSIIGFENVKKVAYFTGSYKIKSFRHVIGNGEMYSEFGLVRDIADSQASELISSENSESLKELLITARGAIIERTIKEKRFVTPEESEKINLILNQ